MPPGSARPGRRRLSPPAVGARPGQRGRPGLPARAGALDNLTGLILIYAAQALPISIWLLRNFVAAVPRDLEEAAAIDGAGPVRVFLGLTSR